MYKLPQFRDAMPRINNSTQGEMIEQKIERIVSNKEPIKDGAPLVYTDRGEGVRPSTDIRTDRWEIAVEATDKIAKSYKARREEKGGQKPKEDVGGPESIQGKVEPTTDNV